MTVPLTHAASRILSQEQIAAVMAELTAILASDSFSSSKRCRDFLEFVVKRALAGDFESLTERFLGAELFGRAIDYETATDSIVRVRATDVRRRLSQYYSGQRSASPVRIDLIAGGYVPEFHWSTEEKPDPSGKSGTAIYANPLTSSGPLGDKPPALETEKVLSGIGKVRPVLLVIAAVLAVLVVSWLVWRQLLPPSTQNDMERFWAPAFHDKSEVLVCFGDTTRDWISPSLARAIEQHPQSVSVEPGQFIVARDESVTVGNLRAALGVMRLLASHGVANQLRWPQEVLAVDLDGRNIVLIGAFNNPWTMSLNKNLRFTFELGGTPDKPIWMIREQMSPNRKWLLEKTDPQPIDHDYAVITRILDPARKRVVISAGGLNQFGTEAAGEFLVDDAAWKEFARTAPKGWEKKNIQIVLEMEVSNGKPVRPRTIASYLW
jgi:hypothetical protein